MYNIHLYLDLIHCLIIVIVKCTLSFHMVLYVRSLFTWKGKRYQDVILCVDGQRKLLHKLHEIETSVGSDVDEMRKKALLLQTLQVVHSNSGIDEQMFRNAMDALRMMPALQTSAGTIMQEDKRTVTFGDLETPAACPPRTMKGGRPASTGLKAWLGRSQ